MRDEFNVCFVSQNEQSYTHHTLTFILKYELSFRTHFGMERVIRKDWRAISHQIWVLLGSD